MTTIFTDTSSRPLELGLRPALDQDVLSGPVRGEDEMSEIYTRNRWSIDKIGCEAYHKVASGAREQKR